jgi:truncated hemoglobin YjbI
MTNKEFIQWLKGFSEACDSAPTEMQWTKIVEKLNETQDELESLKETLKGLKNKIEPKIVKLNPIKNDD